MRMTQAMMIAESQLATTLDPAAGAPFIEQRSDDLAAASWAAFQDIERGGGLLAALADGVIDDLATRAADDRETAIRSGQTDLVGVTLQPRGETVPPVLPAFGHLRRPAAPRSRAALPTARQRGAGGPCVVHESKHGAADGR